MPTGRWRAFDYDDLVKRDKVNLDIFWLKDESLEDSGRCPSRTCWRRPGWRCSGSPGEVPALHVPPVAAHRERREDHDDGKAGPDPDEYVSPPARERLLLLAG